MKAFYQARKRFQSLIYTAPSFPQRRKDTICQDAGKSTYEKNVCRRISHNNPQINHRKGTDLGIILTGYPQLPDKLLFEVPLPSPLGRVAERSEVGRGSLPPCISFAFPQTKAQKPLPSALRAATFPKGEGKALRAPLLQTTICRQISQTDIHILLHRSPRNCGVITVSAVADAIRQGRWSFRRCPSGLPDGWECCSPAAGHG